MSAHEETTVDEDKNGEVVIELNGNKSKSNEVEGIDISFKEIGVKIGKKTILDDVFGFASDGTVTAILGPSGSGKTTLLNALAGRIKVNNGEILMNGGKLNKKLRRTVNFVEQEDIFFSELTLWETLMFRAMFTLPSGMTYKQKKERVQEVIDILDLNKCKDTVIGSQFVQGLSGGEKKRTSIACELISNPVAVLLDEPTSGLDSTIAFELIRIICSYAKKYEKIVILTIHQPSSQIFYSFDRVLLLYDGKVGYFGKVNHALDHLERIGLPCSEHYNPADHLLDLAKSKDPDTISKLEQGLAFLKDEAEYVQNDPEQDDEKIFNGALAYIHEREQVTFSSVQIHHDKTAKWQSSIWIQVLALFVREFKYGIKVVYDWRTIVSCLIFTFMFVILAFQVGRSEEMMDNVLGVIFCIVTYLYFGSIRDELFIHRLEKDIVDRERASGLYRLSSYLIAKFMFLALARPGMPLMIWTGAYWLCLADGFPKFIVSLFIVYYVTLCFSSLNKLLVVIGQDQSTVSSLTIITGLSSYLTTGYWVRNVPVWMSWAMYALPLRYGDNALLSTVVTEDTLIICRQNGTSLYKECNEGAMNVTAAEFLRRQTIYPSPGINIAILTAYMILLWVLIVFVLRVFRTPKH